MFYDEFADLWGKDLTKEFERVFRVGSRFVVIFVSSAYVQKAWPNYERQHALAGRIERMDDSVLPARFDAIELPGMPATVGYLDIGNRTPQELAALPVPVIPPPEEEEEEYIEEVDETIETESETREPAAPREADTRTRTLPRKVNNARPPAG